MGNSKVNGCPTMLTITQNTKIKRLICEGEITNGRLLSHILCNTTAKLEYTPYGSVDNTTRWAVLGINGCLERKSHQVSSAVRCLIATNGTCLAIIDILWHASINQVQTSCCTIQ